MVLGMGASGIGTGIGSGTGPNSGKDSGVAFPRIYGVSNPNKPRMQLMTS